MVDRGPDRRPILIRSPQPSASDLDELHGSYGIRAIINLRGISDEDWYIEELEWAWRNGVQLHSIRVSGVSGVSDDSWAYIKRVIDQADGPVLIHCQGGIHRTGLVVAYYRRWYNGWSIYAALDELEENYFFWTLRDRSRAIDKLVSDSKQSIAR